MSRTTCKRADRGMRRLVASAIASWAAVFVTILANAALWRFELAPASAAWGVFTLVAIFGTAVATLLFGAWQVCVRPNRAFAAGVAMLGATPAVWSGLYAYHMKGMANRRESIVWNVPTRLLAFCSCSVLDAEARWRYPRRTMGKHVTLIDDGATPNPARLVDAMDAHLAQMAEFLGQPVPSIKTHWVRGRLAGQDGRAVINLAICNVPDHAQELTYLDRHEAAHTLITLLSGRDQEPPMILAEGWAEYFSQDRDHMLRSLKQLQLADEVVSLDEMIGPEWYGRSDGPAYYLGGPFACFLIERYSAAKFFQLYREVRRATFRDDFERIVGVSWHEAGQEFWKWLDENADHKPPEYVLKEIEFAPGVDRQLWERIAQNIESTLTPASNGLPADLAIAIDGRWSGTTDGKPTSGRLRWWGVFQGDAFWIHSENTDGDFYYAVSDVSQHGCVVGKVDGESRRDVNNARTKDRVRKLILSDAQYYIGTMEMSRVAPLTPDPHGSRIRIEEVKSIGSDKEGPWLIRWTSRFDDEQSKMEQSIVLDPTFDWRQQSETVISEEYQYRRHIVLERSGTEIYRRSISGDFVGQTGQQSFECSARLLTNHERDDFIRTVRRAVFDIPPVRDRLSAPKTIAVAWPTLGVLLLLGPIVAKRWRRERAPS